MQRALLMISVACFSTTALANTEISLEDVPAHVLETALETAPGVTFDYVSIETENGETVYEFEAEDHNGNHIEIDVLSDGSLDEIELELEWRDVPEAVVETLQTTFPNFEPSYIELSIRDGNRQFVYEFEGEFEGQQVDIEIDASGELLVFSEDTLT